MGWSTKLKDVAKNNQPVLWSVAAIVAGIIVGLRLSDISADDQPVSKTVGW